mgnify:CR=1 FL=1
MQGHIREMAALLRGMGRGGDTILAHINPQEAMLLDAVTDGGSINPVTGMPEFDMFADQTEIGEPGEHDLGLDNASEEAFYDPPPYEPPRNIISPDRSPIGQAFDTAIGFIPNPTTLKGAFDLGLSVASLGTAYPALRGASYANTALNLAARTSPPSTAKGFTGPGPHPDEGTPYDPQNLVDIDTLFDLVEAPPPSRDSTAMLSAPSYSRTEIADALGITTTPTDEQQIASNAAPSPMSLTMEPPDAMEPPENMQPLGSPVDVQPAQTMPNLGPMDAVSQTNGNAPYTVFDEYLDKAYDVVRGIPNFVATLPDRLTASIPGQQASTNTGLPPDYFEESNDPFNQTPLQMTSPQQVAEQIIAQQELVNALTQPGYTRAGQGRIYL